METLQARHRKERQDLQSRITQKKKSATKKTRKAVNADCEDMERDLNERHARELFQANGDAIPAGEEAIMVENADPIDVLDASSDLPSGADVEATKVNEVVKEGEPETTPGVTRKPNRQKARLARRAAELEAQATQAAEEASALPNLRESERRTITDQLKKFGLQEQDIRPDGHCLYSAVADQLTSLSLRLQPDNMSVSSSDGEQQLPGYKLIRQVAAEYVQLHADDFEPFLEEPLDDYVRKIRETAEWGGHLELLAIARAYGLKINVLQGDGRLEEIEPDSGNKGNHASIWLAYYRHNFGLGEHYNSLRRDAA